MYSNITSVQVVVSLMKEFGICDVVLSPGGSDIPLIHSIETDDYFNCYSVVDERSAVYFAMGVAQQNNRPCACICTSGTAVCNYVPGITEAFYQNVPVLAITADKNPYFQDQLETQKIKQEHIFDGVVKKSVNLPLINSEEDHWLCNRMVNEAMLELTHHGTGPVQINIPIVGRTDIYDCKELPCERSISIQNPLDIDWDEYVQKLKDKRIMVVVGQNLYLTDDDINTLIEFYNRFNCFFAVEHLSNLKFKGALNTYPLTETHTTGALVDLLPEIVISVGNNLSAYQLKPLLRKHYKKIQNWYISESGMVRDAYKSLTTVFECNPMTFFKCIVANSKNDYSNNHSYFDMWRSSISEVKMPELSFSNFYVAKALSRIIPPHSILHTAILNSTRIMQFYDLAEGVKCYSNVGALGIDGCFSTFAGQAAATDQLAYLVIGDLSFFYDMNAAGLRSIGSNVRVILLNNGGGSEFQFFMGKKRIPTLDSYICAEHENVATGWIKSLNYDYYVASNSEEFDNVIEKFGKPSERPMFLEVLTDMEEDADKTNAFYDTYRSTGNAGASGLKNVIKKTLPQSKIAKIKKIMQIIKEK